MAGDIWGLQDISASADARAIAEKLEEVDQGIKNIETILQNVEAAVEAARADFDNNGDHDGLGNYCELLTKQLDSQVRNEWKELSAKAPDIINQVLLINKQKNKMIEAQTML